MDGEQQGPNESSITDHRTGTPPTSFIAPADRWGPFADGLDPSERLARLRSLRAITHLCLGPRGAAVVDALHQSERDPNHMPTALRALDALAPLDRRQVLASFARLHRPAA